MSRDDQKAVREILRAGIQQVRVVLRAIALEQLAAGQTAPVVARIVHLSAQAVRRIAHRYQKAGLAACSGMKFEKWGAETRRQISYSKGRYNFPQRYRLRRRLS